MPPAYRSSPHLATKSFVSLCDAHSSKPKIAIAATARRSSCDMGEHGVCLYVGIVTFFVFVSMICRSRTSAICGVYVLILFAGLVVSLTRCFTVVPRVWRSVLQDAELAQSEVLWGFCDTLVSLILTAYICFLLVCTVELWLNSI
jgi:hypothetical protein